LENIRGWRCQEIFSISKRIKLGVHPVRNNALLLCSGVTFQIIPVGFNALLEFLTGFTL
jgi:hypothetical protein